MKQSPAVTRRRNSSHTHSPRPISMYGRSPFFKSSSDDFRGSSSSLYVEESTQAKTSNLSFMKELKKLKRNSSAEFLNTNIFAEFGFNGKLPGLNELSENFHPLSREKKKSIGSIRPNMLPAGPSASTWSVPKSIKKLGITGNVFGVHISKSGICYASVVTEKGDRLIQAFDRNGNHVKSFHVRATKAGKSFEPYQIRETPEGHLAVASGSSVTVWSKEGKLVTEHGKNMFKFAKSIAVRSTGEIIITDTDNQSVKAISSSGQQIHSLDGKFQCPVGVAVDSKDHIIVSDWNGKISVFDSENELVLTFGVKGSNPGELDLPYGVAVDSEDNIVVADMWNHRLSVFTQGGEFLKHLASDPGQSVRLPAQISVASGLTPHDYRLAVVDFGANSVKVFSY